MIHCLAFLVRPAGGLVAASLELYQTLQTDSFRFTIGWPPLQENASANSGMFTTTPLMRNFGGACGSTTAHIRNCSGRTSPQVVSCLRKIFGKKKKRALKLETSTLSRVSPHDVSQLSS